MPTAHVNIGSNLGNSRSILEQAVAGIALLAGGNLRRSQFIESDAWGFNSPNRFLNLGVEFDTNTSPEILLCRLLAIQNSISATSHRTLQGTYADRLIDIDLIYYGNTVIDTPILTLPHPRMHLRRFVLLPIAELSPQWIHPSLQQTATQMLSHIGNLS